MDNKERKRNQLVKNKLMLFVLSSLCLLFYGLTIVKLKGF